MLSEKILQNRSTTRFETSEFICGTGDKQLRFHYYFYLILSSYYLRNTILSTKEYVIHQETFIHSFLYR